MRRTISEQLLLAPPPLPFPKAAEYAEISRILDECPEAASLVLGDLLAGEVDATRGRRGMTGDQVLRAKVLKQREGVSYQDLAFEIAANNTFRQFCRQEPTQTWSRSTLHRNLAKVSPETLEKVDHLVLGVACEAGHETGERVAVDATATETDIHPPTDSKLLYDVVRVLSRMSWCAVSWFVTDRFTDCRQAAARLNWRISSARRREQRVPLYAELLEIADLALKDARRLAGRLSTFADEVLGRAANHLREALLEVVCLGERVVDQADRRILQEKRVPAKEKILSIFEPHTDLIVQGNTIVYGHKITLASGASGLVLDMAVEQGNPADVSKTIPILERLTQILGAPPRQAAFDGGYSSRANLSAAKALGVEDVCFSKHPGLCVEDMTQDRRTFEELRCFRTGVERVISLLKGTFGLRRCDWSGFEGFKAYAWSTVVAANLTVLARLRLAKRGPPP